MRLCLGLVMMLYLINSALLTDGGDGYVQAEGEDSDEDA